MNSVAPLNCLLNQSPDPMVTPIVQREIFLLFERGRISRSHLHTTFVTERRYTKKHEWVSVDGEIGTVGITVFAQVSHVRFLNFPLIFSKSVNWKDSFVRQTKFCQSVICSLKLFHFFKLTASSLMLYVANKFHPVILSPNGSLCL